MHIYITPSGLILATQVKKAFDTDLNLSKHYYVHFLMEIITSFRSLEQ